MLRTRFRTRARFIPALSGGGAFSITNSLRFNDDDSAYLSRTPSVAGDRKTWTWSGWVKLGNFSSDFNLISARTGITAPLGLLRIYSATKGYQLNYAARNSSNVVIADISTNAVLRDPSGWYHIVVALDTTQATSSDRLKIYINGVIQSVTTTTAVTLNSEGAINGVYEHNIGKQAASAVYGDGYLAEVNFIDGQALTADDFGQIDETTGEWSPKKYSGTYGTNGFYLPFNGNANDSSGNGNNWTENNLAVTDYMIDTPTNNFATLNPLNKGSGITLQEGNLNLTNASGTNAVTTTFTSEKYYYEIVLGSLPTNSYIGIISDLSFTEYVVYGINGYGFLSVGFGSPTSTVTGSGSVGDIMGIAVDVSSGTIEFYKNNVSMGVISNITFGSTFYNSFSFNNTVTTPWRLNFGQDSSFAGNKTRQGNTDANGIGDFYYEPPTGYLALCTDNLPAPAIEQPETQFNVVTYTGNSADRNIDLGFPADFVWIKRREIASQNCLYDSVRGDGKLLYSNLTNVEYNGVNDGIHFDYANGFNIDVGANVSYYNETGGSYVAWCWKAGGTAVTNTDGTITSQVSANVDAGFSIVNWTATSNGYTVGHGLSSAPELIITKSRALTTNWWTFTTLIDGSVDFLGLNLTNAKADDSIGLSAPTSTVFSMHSGYTSTPTDVIAYCFHSVESFSKFGSYVGNGSADGPFVYTGFKPAFVLIKCTDTNANGHWIMKDNLRAADYNPASGNLYANLNYAEDTTASLNVDLLANGFKIKGDYAGTNASGANFIYMAFAESPTKFSLGR